MPPFFGGTMSEIFEKEGTAAGKKHICVMEMIHIADRDADFFWNQLFDLILGKRQIGGIF